MGKISDEGMVLDCDPTPLVLHRLGFQRTINSYYILPNNDHHGGKTRNNLKWVGSKQVKRKSYSSHRGKPVCQSCK